MPIHFQLGLCCSAPNVIALGEYNWHLGIALRHILMTPIKLYSIRRLEIYCTVWLQQYVEHDNHFGCKYILSKCVHYLHCSMTPINS